eukprot:scaffold291182_cov29-Tisochrysis_lutea.AAC.1
MASVSGGSSVRAPRVEARISGTPLQRWRLAHTEVPRHDSVIESPSSTSLSPLAPSDRGT